MEGGVICKCTQKKKKKKLPQTGSVGWTSHERCRGGEGGGRGRGRERKKKTEGARAVGAWHISPPERRAGRRTDGRLKPAGSARLVERTKGVKVAPSRPSSQATGRATMSSGRKRFSEPQTQRCAKGSGAVGERGREARGTPLKLVTS